MSFANEKLIIKVINDLYFDMKKKLPNKLISLIIKVFLGGSDIFTPHKSGLLEKSISDSLKLAIFFFYIFLCQLYIQGIAINI